LLCERLRVLCQDYREHLGTDLESPPRPSVHPDHGQAKGRLARAKANPPSELPPPKPKSATRRTEVPSPTPPAPVPEPAPESAPEPESAQIDICTRIRTVSPTFSRSRSGRVRRGTRWSRNLTHIRRRWRFKNYRKLSRIGCFTRGNWSWSFGNDLRRRVYGNRAHTTPQGFRSRRRKRNLGSPVRPWGQLGLWLM
jgi:hypothetical protein